MYLDRVYTFKPVISIGYMEKTCLTLNIFLEKEFWVMNGSAQLSRKKKLFLFLAEFYLIGWIQMFLI
jgi:hypothetical protein